MSQNDDQSQSDNELELDLLCSSEDESTKDSKSLSNKKFESVKNSSNGESASSSSNTDILTDKPSTPSIDDLQSTKNPPSSENNSEEPSSSIEDPNSVKNQPSTENNSEEPSSPMEDSDSVKNQPSSENNLEEPSSSKESPESVRNQSSTEEQPSPIDKREPVNNLDITDSEDETETKKEEPRPNDTENQTPPPKMLRRADWGAARPKWIDVLDIPVEKVVVSYTETDPCYTEEDCKKFVRDLQQKHLQDKNEPDIKHNFLIGGDEAIYEGRGYFRKGPTYKPTPKRLEELTGKSIDIAFIERSSSKVPKAVVQSLSYVLAKGINEQILVDNFKTCYVIDNEIHSIMPSKQELKEIESNSVKPQ